MNHTPKFYLCGKCGPVHVIPNAGSLFGLNWHASHCGGDDHFTDEQVTDRPAPQRMRDPIVTDTVAWLVQDDREVRGAGTLHFGTVTGVQKATVEVLEEDSDTVSTFHKRYVELVPFAMAGGVWE